jgi:phosphoglycerate dehydrogenase-like enzyme
MNVLINAPLPKAREKEILQLSPRINLLHANGHGVAKDRLSQADVIYTEDADFDPADAPRLRWVQTNSAAINHLAEKPIFRCSVPLANVSGAYSIAVAEFAVGMLIAVSRRIPLGCRYQSERRWPEDYAPFCGEDLCGKTMGIVGYGSIGRHIAGISQAMGMTVLACKRNPAIRRDTSYQLPGMGDPDGNIPRAWFGVKQIAEMFRRSDVVIVSLPHTRDTENLIGEHELAALPLHAYLVNVGRGPAIDEHALVRCLQSGAIAGAALDVFACEPLSPDSPLWTLSNVLVMPHVASWTKVQAERAAGVLVENLRRDLGGEPLINVVDKQLMY